MFVRLFDRCIDQRPDPSLIGLISLLRTSIEANSRILLRDEEKERDGRVMEFRRAVTNARFLG